MDQTRLAQIDPDARLTPRRLVDLLRDLAGEDRAPIGIRSVRRAIRLGELRAARVANRHLVRWGDVAEWLEGPARAPIQLEPTAAERVERDVQAHIRREESGRGTSAPRDGEARRSLTGRASFAEDSRCET